MEDAVKEPKAALLISVGTSWLGIRQPERIKSSEEASIRRGALRRSWRPSMKYANGCSLLPATERETSQPRVWRANTRKPAASGGVRRRASGNVVSPAVHSRRGAHGRGFINGEGGSEANSHGGGACAFHHSDADFSVYVTR